MNNRQQVMYLPRFGEPRYSARDNSVMQHVISNVVINMETVLCDLKDIMGEITTIVDHIDNVTDKIEKKDKGQAESSSKLLLKSNLRNRMYLDRLQWNADPDDRDLGDNVDTEGSSVVCRKAGNHNVVKVNGQSRTKEDGISNYKQLAAIRPNSDQARVSSGWQQDAQNIFSSKSFRHLPKDGNVSMPQNGAIAIVYPTIINNQSVQTADKVKETFFTLKSEICDSGSSSIHENIGKSEVRSCIDDVTSNHKKVILLDPSLESGSLKTKALQEDEKIFTCLKTLQKEEKSLSMTEKKSLKSQSSGAVLEDVITITKNVKSPKLVESKEKVYQLSVKSTDNSTITDLSNTLQSNTLQYSPINIQSSEGLGVPVPLDVRSKSCLAHSSPKSVYNRGKMSSGIIESPKAKCQSGFHCFNEYESDLESDFVTEKHDNRCATSVKDLSDLSLSDNTNVRDTPLNCLKANFKHKPYKIPATHVPKPECSLLPFQQRPNKAASRQEFNSPSVKSIQRSLSKMSMLSLNTQAVLESPVWTHAFCNEVNGYESDRYCGCYEILADSVLENSGDCQSFEEASDDIQSIDAMNISYASLSNEYQEDDWDTGMKFDDQTEYDLSSVGSQDVYEDEHSNVDKLDSLRSNRLPVVKGHYVSSMTNKVYSLALKNTNEDNDEFVHLLKKYKEQSMGKRDCDMHNSHTRSEISRNSIFGDYYETPKPGVTYKQYNITHRPNSLSSDRIKSHDDKQLRENVSEAKTSILSSDDPLSMAIESPSSISFSSIRTFNTSPETDILGSSYDGDDLSESQYDSNSLSSESRLNTSVSIHKAKIKRLRKDFFKTLYKTCENVEKEKEQNIERWKVVKQDKKRCSLDNQKICLESNLSEIDKNIDNISDSGSYQESLHSYNRSVNTWTAYTLAHKQTDNISDSSSDMFNDSNITSSITTTSNGADNVDSDSRV